MNGSPSRQDTAGPLPSPAAGVRLPGLAAPRRQVIVLGNEKGGSGKSTTAMHVTVSLLKGGHTVGCIDLDARQGTLSRYVENRRAFAAESGLPLAVPEVRRVQYSERDGRAEAEAEEQAALADALSELSGCSAIVIDTPGSDNYLSRLGHAEADILITPLNDSFLDIDVLARVDRRKREVLGPSNYCKLVWEENDRRVAVGRQPIEWIVMRNRLAHLDSRNNREVSGLLQQLSQRIGFRLEHGLSERVVFRELFLQGLTLLDLNEGEAEDRQARASHAHARQEIDALLRMVGDLGRERRRRAS